MNSREINRIREILKSDDFKKGVMEQYEKDQQKLRELIKVNFKEHANHTQEDGDWNYFDAMFVSVDMICSCGDILKITRDMI